MSSPGMTTIKGVSPVKMPMPRMIEHQFYNHSANDTRAPEPRQTEPKRLDFTNQGPKVVNINQIYIKKPEFIPDYNEEEDLEKMR